MDYNTVTTETASEQVRCSKFFNAYHLRNSLNDFVSKGTKVFDKKSKKCCVCNGPFSISCGPLRVHLRSSQFMQRS